MRKTLIASLVGLTMVVASPAASKQSSWPALGVETEILYPGRMIRNFEADQDRGIWIEDIKSRWYYARFASSCSGVQFAQGLGFDTKGSARFGRSSAIVMEGDLCQIESLVTAEKPLPRKQREAAAKASTSR